jgi:large conductance mechanosensitive channel
MAHQSGFWADFRSFAVKGNVLDLAIAVVIGNAFSGVINSLVGDIITPVIGLLTNNVDFKTLVYAPHADLVIKYGMFLQALFNFLVISLSIFLIFKIISAARKRLFNQGEKATPPEQKPAQERLLEEIRDLLKSRPQ